MEFEGADTLIGGAGDDIFQFSNLNDLGNRISDFAAGDKSTCRNLTLMLERQVTKASHLLALRRLPMLPASFVMRMAW